VFEYFRTEALTAATSDGKPLIISAANQFGGSFRWPDYQKIALLLRRWRRHSRRSHPQNLSVALGPGCSVATPVAGVDDAAINASPECQRVALLNFFKTAPFPSGIQNTDEGAAVDHSIRTPRFSVASTTT